MQTCRSYRPGLPAARSWLAIAAVCLLTICLGGSSYGQTCPPNMLTVTGAGSYVGTPDAPTLHVTKGYTIECWARLGSFQRYAAIFDKGNGSYSYFGLFLDSGDHIYARTYAKGQLRLNGPKVPNINEWHHYALVCSPGDSLYLYLDGIRVASMRFTAAGIDSSRDSLRIGGSSAGTSWIGDIDEFRIWNTPKSGAAIRAALGHSLTGTEAGLVLYYPFDDQLDARRIHDFSNHGNDGFLRGENLEIAPSTSPITTHTPGFRLDLRERTLIIPTKRCAPSFDTVLHIRNLGTSALLVSPLSVGFYRGLAFSVTSSFPLILPADTTVYQEIRVHFSPPTGGVFDDSLYISSTDECAGTVRIGIRGVYDSVGIVSSPDTIRFGSRTQCQLPLIQTVTIRNTSATDTLQIIGQIVPAGSGVTVLTPLPITLAKGESRTIQLRVEPGSPGAVAATLSFQLDKCSRQALLRVEGRRERASLTLDDVIIGPLANFSGTVTFDTVVVVRNNGTIPLAMSSAVASADSNFTFRELRQNVFLLPGDTVQLRLHLASNRCGEIYGSLRIRGSMCGIDTAVAIKVSILPPVALTAAPLEVGVACIFKDTTIVVSNPNDFSVGLDTLTFRDDALFFTPLGSFPRTIAAHSSISVRIRFAPGVDGDFTTVAYLHMSPCGIGSVPLHGVKGILGVHFREPAVSFGRGCDLQPVIRTATVTNTSTRPVTIGDTIRTGSYRYTISGRRIPFVLLPGDSTTFTVTYTPAPGSKDDATLTFFTPEGCPITHLALSGSRELTSATWSLPSLLFDTVCAGSTSVKKVALRHAGIDSLDVIGLTTSDAHFTVLQAPHAVAPGASDTISVLFAPTQAQEYKADLLFRTACGDTIRLALAGSGGPAAELLASSYSHDFGTVHVGDSATYCLTFTNPGCEPIVVSADALPFGSTPFHLTAASLAALPQPVSRGTTLTLCVTFAPTDHTLVTDSVPLTVAGHSYGSITFSGVGAAPDVRITEQRLDYGYVLHGSSKGLSLHVANVGNLPAELSFTTLALDFTAPPSLTLAPGASDIITVNFAPSPATTQIQSALIISWDTHHDTVTLSGAGTDKGMQLSSLGVDFGHVRVGTTLTKDLAITAAIDPPNVQVPVLTGPASAFSVTSSVPLPHLITSDKDTVWLHISYSPTVEDTTIGSLSVSDGVTPFVVLLTGRGVEAHPLVSPPYISIGPITLETSYPFKVTLRDTGAYPLTLQNVHFASGIHFSIGSWAPEVIEPAGSRTYTLYFTPHRARVLEDTLWFETNSPDKTPFIALTGVGIHPVQDRPDLTYSVGSYHVHSGDNVRIPITLEGTQLQNLDADSVILTVRFDPTMVWLHDVTPGPLTRSIRSWHMVDDSTVSVTLVPVAFRSEVLCYLNVEALLGDHRVTYIRVMDASPLATFAPAATDGMFEVTDCGNDLHGVTFEGDYAVGNSAPNPARSSATLHYSLGIAADVRIQIFSNAGQLLQTIALPDQPVGEHIVPLNVSAFPNGTYTYRVQSLEFSGTGSIVVLH